MKKFIKSFILVLLILPCTLIFVACGKEPPETKYFERTVTYTYYGREGHITVEWESDEVKNQFLDYNPNYSNELDFINRNISVTVGSYYKFNPDGTGTTGNSGFTYEINNKNITLTLTSSGNVYHFIITEYGITRIRPFYEDLGSNSKFLIHYY